MNPATNIYTNNNTTILQQQAGIAPSLEKTSIPSNSKDYRIFMVDDDLMMRKILHRTFAKNENFDIHLFATGEECIAQLAAVPDIVVLDYHLSIYDETVMNGLDVLKKIKQYKPETKVIMLSSQSEVSVAVKCLKKGAIDYVVKDDTMRLSIQKSVDNVIHSLELKKEIRQLSETVKRDKLLIKGYSVLILFLCVLVCCLFFS